MQESSVKFIFRGQGVQRHAKDAAPVPFDFERFFFNGDMPWDNATALFLNTLCPTFSMAEFEKSFKVDLSPAVAISVLKSYARLNQAINKDAMNTGEFVAFDDGKVREPLERRGYMSPKEVQSQVSTGMSYNKASRK
jgi:hypothetical protein